MICKQCGKNEAVIQMHMQINENMEKVELCESCYRNILHQSGMTTGNGNQGSGSSPFDDMVKGFFSGQGDFGSQGDQKQQSDGRKGNDGGLLDQFGRNLTQIAKAGLIDPVIGRDEEVERVSEILNRRNKNNPVLIGEPGVGKTAIAEGLALKIAKGDVPAKLRRKDVYSLDVSSLVAGTPVRGQFEQRMKEIISELQEKNNVILFVDEVHQIVGAGSAEGSMDAGNILKPALARGELQMIGATTLKEYRDIEKDAALERRFQPVKVDEPSVEETVRILQGLRERYEAFHQVKFTDDVVKACAALSERYVQDRYLPDKAIDLMDEAGSKANLQLSDKDQDQLQERLDEVVREKEQAAENEDYERAAFLRQEEIQLEEKRREAEKEDTIDYELNVEDIQLIVEKKTGIPVRKMQQDEQEKMKNLAQHLNQRVIGQEEAVQKVSRAIRRSRAGLNDPHRPIGSFLFLGPTGVGKTELSKNLAQELFGDRNNLLRLDMSEYMEKHAVSKLIGSPPGYIGHDEAGQLTERIRRQPYSILLLDEMEKAHPDVQHMFLQILDDGHLTDSQGRTVSFKNTVIIMTTNAGVEQMHKSKLGFGETESNDDVNAMETLKDYFKPEFLNRIDSIVSFNQLETDDLLRIVDLMLEDTAKKLQGQAITLDVSDRAKEKIAVWGYNPVFGARPLRRVIQERVEDEIADLLLEEENVRSVRVDADEENLIVQNQK